MQKIEVEIGTPVVYYHDIDGDGIIDPDYLLVAEILEDGYLNLAAMARMQLPKGFTNPVPYAPVPVSGHWTHRYSD